MKVNIKKGIHWISTILMCAMFAFSAHMYLTKYDTAAGFFDMLGFPRYLIYPLAWAKIAGIFIVLFEAVPGVKSWGRATLKAKDGPILTAYIFSILTTLKEWAYAGFFFDAVLATMAHHHAGHGMMGMSLYAIGLVLISRLTWRRNS